MSKILHSSRAAAKQAFADHVVEQMHALGPVYAKAMFGGHGIYLDGLMFALIADEQLYFKTDEQTVQAFVDRGLAPFTYEAKGRGVASLKYHQAPPEVLDDAATMLQWARPALECALRNRRKPNAAGQSKGKAAPARAGLAELPNLGPKCQEMLALAGIRTEKDLRKLGSVQAYVRTKVVWPQASLNLLWALEGALSGRSWQEVAQTDRASLLMALEDVERARV